MLEKKKKERKKKEKIGMLKKEKQKEKLNKEICLLLGKTYKGVCLVGFVAYKPL